MAPLRQYWELGNNNDSESITISVRNSSFSFLYIRTEPASTPPAHRRFSDPLLRRQGAASLEIVSSNDASANEKPLCRNQFPGPRHPN
jgi:hypothetical protein